MIARGLSPEHHDALRDVILIGAAQAMGCGILLDCLAPHVPARPSDRKPMHGTPARADKRKGPALAAHRPDFPG